MKSRSEADRLGQIDLDLTAFIAETKPNPGVVAEKTRHAPGVEADGHVEMGRNPQRKAPASVEREKSLPFPGSRREPAEPDVEASLGRSNRGDGVSGSRAGRDRGRERDDRGGEREPVQFAFGSRGSIQVSPDLKISFKSISSCGVGSISDRCLA